MTNRNEKLPTVGASRKEALLPVKKGVFDLLPALGQGLGTKGKLPNASVVYGMASSALFVVAIYFLFTGLWFTGLLVSVLAACFLGYALHFLKYR